MTLIASKRQLLRIVFLIAFHAARSVNGEVPTLPQNNEVPASVVFARVAPSTVIVHCKFGERESQGSGVVVGVDEIVTNYHVIEGSTNIEIRQGERRWKAVLKAFDPKRDLALLSVSGLDRPRILLRASTEVKVGDKVYAISAPRGLELSLSDGLVSALRSAKNEIPNKSDDKKAAVQETTPSGASLIQTTAPVSPGSSGGGLYDNHGRLIGIITFSSNGQSLNFALPSEWVNELRDADGIAASSKIIRTKQGDAQYGLSRRPDNLSCIVDTQSTWGLFSGGTEILESSTINRKWNFKEFDSQLPKCSAPGSAAIQLVLSDLNRQSGFIRFSRADSGPGLEFFFWLDDDETFKLTAIEPINLYGQLRLKATSGSCSFIKPLEPYAPAALPLVKGPSWLLDAMKTCEKGTTAVCIATARALLTEPVSTRFKEAEWLFEKACEQGLVDACTEAAKLCDTLNLSLRATQLRNFSTKKK